MLKDFAYPLEYEEDRIDRVRKSVKNYIEAVSENLGSDYKVVENPFSYSIKRGFLSKEILSAEFPTDMAVPEYMFGHKITISVLSKNEDILEIAKEYAPKIEDCEFNFVLL